MYSADYVNNLINDLKNQGKVMSDIAWNAALACIGWPYVFGARGEYCTPANRRAKYRDDCPTIKTACKNYDGSGTCVGCKWYPNSQRVRFFDCRGFTYWILLQVYGWKLMGTGATSQWNTESNWKAKGTIDTMPENTLVCLFYKEKKDPSKMAHTGFGFNNETIECSNGVQYRSKRDAKWQYWAIPACVEEGGGGTVTPVKPTLRRGDKGNSVRELQTILAQKGYDLGKYGIDGSFGKCTEDAVKSFQKSAGLTADGIVGPATWNALENDPAVVDLYTVEIKGLTLSEADELLSKYKNAVKRKE